MAEGQFQSATEDVCRTREGRKPWEGAELQGWCSMKPPENKSVASHYHCRKGTCELLSESFSLWWSVNKHKMHVSFGSGFYSQMNEFE